MLTKGSVFDLAAVYTLLFIEKEIGKQGHENIIGKFSYILDKGYTYKECMNVMLNFMNNATRKKNFKIKDILSFTSGHENILKQSMTYYHKELRITPEPNMVDIDYNTGDMVSTKQEFFVEMAASYTLNELIQYLLSFGYVNTKQWQPNRLKGIMKHYIGKYEIDTVLFMIEAVANNIETKEFDFNRFDNFYQIAKGYMNNIINNCKSNGGNTIEPRKRMQFSGSGVWL